MSQKKESIRSRAVTSKLDQVVMLLVEHPDCPQRNLGFGPGFEDLLKLQ